MVMIQRYFLILAAGHTGSAWLAKLLNSHFEVMCFHELETISYTLHWPPRVRAYFEFGHEERLRNLLYLFSPSHRYGDSYQVLGAIPAGATLDIRGTMKAAARYFPDSDRRTRLFVLMRNPVSQIHSQMEGFRRMEACGAAEIRMRDFHRELSWGVLTRMDPGFTRPLLREMHYADPDAEYFLHACFHYVRLLWAAQEASATLAYRSVLRLEDLAQNERSLRDALQEITGVEYSLPANFGEKVNVKSGGSPAWTLFQSWSHQRRRVFAQVFEPYWRTLESLGYDLDILTTPSASAGECAHSHAPGSAFYRPGTRDADRGRRLALNEAASR
jgi:hypothetical protein